MYVYMDFLFLVNVLVCLVNMDVVMLERIFSNDDVRELLSLLLLVGRNVRRIFFVEVVEELF